MEIVVVDESNLKIFTELSILLFPEEEFNELFQLYRKSFESQKEVGFLCRINSRFIGIIHLSIRTDYVNGTDTSPVVFVEAIYVLPEYRKHGIGKYFIDHAEKYALQNGIKQIASDCLIDNYDSERFHKCCGFKETERVIYFVKEVKI
jgi:aminoglycoside 6'-N-acetyltransferase I